MNYEKETTGISTYVSLCSGYDGIGIGLKRAIPNLRTIAHCEIEAYAIANLIAKMEEGQLDACPVFTDLKQFPYRELRDRVTILSAGFPCQPFSSSGLRQSTDDERHLYPWIARGITAMRPRYVFLENVEGIISAKTGDGESVLKYVLGDLGERGYNTTWGIFSAEEVGAPHRRKRVFILGNSSSVGSCGGSEDENGQQPEVLGERLESYEDVPYHKDTRTRTDDQRVRQRFSGTHRGEGTDRPRFPARPNEEQYEWEEPRTLKSCMGLSANGDSTRVDRLRLLGNGVLPDTCELAFNTLIKQL